MAEEVLRSIPHAPNYVISSKGYVQHVNRSKPLKVSDGTVTLVNEGYRRGYRVSTLMLELFKDLIYIDNPYSDSVHIHYLDGNKDNLSIDNLLVTTSGRKKDFNYVLYTPDSDNPFDREHYFLTYDEIVDKFKIGRQTVSKLLGDGPFIHQDIYNEKALIRRLYD